MMRRSTHNEDDASDDDEQESQIEEDVEHVFQSGNILTLIPH